MDGLAIALRAVWWRRGISAAVLLIAAFATGVAAASPIYLAAASDSILQHTLRAAPASATGTGIEVSAAAVGKPTLRGLDDTITKALRGRELQRAFPGARRVEGIEYRTTIVGPNGDPAARVTAVFRQDACAHLRVLRGHCTTEQDVDGAMVSASTAAIEQWRVGQQVAVAQFQDPAGPRGRRDRAVRIVGIYAPTDPDGAYWYNSTRGYFGGPDRLAEQRRREQVPILEAMLVPESSFSRITARNDASVNLIADLGFDPDQIHPSVVASLRTQLDRFGTALAALPVNQRGFSGALVTGLREVLDRAAAGQRSLRVPILVVVFQLEVLGWFVLFMVVANAADARGGEIALAKLRGLPASSTLAFGLLEAIVLLAAAVPAGVGLGLVAVVAGAGPVLGPHAQVAFQPLAWVTALAAADVVVGTLAAAGLLELWFGGTLRGDHLDVLALIAPGLLILGGALAGARLLPLLARTAFRGTRGSPRLGLFFGVRQVARRPAGLRVVVVLATAFGLAIFAVVGWSVFAANRHDRAVAELGAARVVRVDPYAGPNLQRVVEQLDPGGRQAMAVLDAPSSVEGTETADISSGTGPSAAPLRLLAVDPRRLAAVGYWRGDFADRSLGGAGGVAARLQRPSRLLPPPLPISGDALRLSLATDIACCGPVALAADLTDAGGKLVTIRFGRLTSGGAEHRYQGTLPSCAADPCQLRQLYLTRARPGAYALVGAIQISVFEQHRSSGWQNVDAAFDAARWQPLNPRIQGSDRPVEQLAAFPGTLGASFTAPPRVLQVGLGTPIPTRIPALVTTPFTPVVGTSALGLATPDGPSLDVDVRGEAAYLPRAGVAGAMVALDQLAAARAGGYASLAPNQVWLSPAAPADFPARLRAAGVHVTGVDQATDRARILAHQGPSLAIFFLLAGAAAALLAAALGVSGAILLRAAVPARLREAQA